MFSFATTPVYGLGMTAEEFWSSTPREMQARRKVFENAREFAASMYAGLQATLHNAHFRHEKSQPVYTPAMFLPGYKPPRNPHATDESWRAFKRQAMGLTHVRTPQERAQILANAQEFDRRQARAATAQRAGATRAEVLAIMEGSTNGSH